MREDDIDRVDLVRRIIALRKHKRIGVVLVEEDRWWISTSEIDPHGHKVRHSVAGVLAKVIELEALYSERKPVASEVQIRKVASGE